MAEFIVNTNQLHNQADKLAQLQRELDSVAVRLGAMQLGSVLQVKASTAVIATVGDCKWAAAHQSDDLGRLARGLNEVASIYEGIENDLKEPKTQEQAEAAQESDNLLVDISDFIDGLSWIGDVIGEGLDVAVDGAGDVVSFIMRFFQNVSEFDGDFTDPRFWGEWFLETGVEIAKGSVIAAAVTGALMLMGVSAGGVVVAGATVVVGWIVDGIYELITGNEGGITEAISDAILDGAEAVIEAGKKVVDDVVDKVEDTVEKVTDGVKTTWNKVVDIFS